MGSIIARPAGIRAKTGHPREEKSERIGGGRGKSPRGRFTALAVRTDAVNATPDARHASGTRKSPPKRVREEKGTRSGPPKQT